MENVRSLSIVSSAFILFYSMIAKHMHDSYYIPDPIVMALFGIFMGKEGVGLLHPPHSFSKVILAYSARVLLCMQTMAVALSLPSNYLKNNKRTLLILIGLGGFAKCTIIFLLLRVFSSLSTPTCWAIAASFTPTDPILSSSIVRGKFARRNVPEHLRNLLAAESGINDGFGILILNISVEVLTSYREIFNSLYLNRNSLSNCYLPATKDSCRQDIDNCYCPNIEQYLRMAELGNLHSLIFINSQLFQQNQNISNILGPLWKFIINTLGRKVLLSSLIGYGIGYITRIATKAFCAMELVRSEVLLVHSFVLSFMILALMDCLDGSELICIFFTGSALNSDSWYTLDGTNRKLTGIIEDLLSNVFFVFMGSLVDVSRMNPRVVLLSLAIVIFTRPLSIFAVRRLLPHRPSIKDTLFIGWFGPIGVGALYYCVLYDNAMNTLTMDFALCIVFFSTIIHGISVPVFCIGRELLRFIKPQLRNYAIYY